MARRKLQEVDASSIADIAFILLAFIIIATTLEKESGLPAVLPQKKTIKTPPPPVNEKNILEILINSKDQLMIEKQWDKELDDIKEYVIEFMTNPKRLESLPNIKEITQEDCIAKIALIKGNIDAARDRKKLGEYNKELKEWEEKLSAAKLLGGKYEVVNDMATIAIRYDLGTSYGQYLGVRDEIMSGINELRDQLALKHFNTTYSALEKIRTEVKTDEDRAKIKAIRKAFPQKIIKLPPKKVN